MLKGFKSHAPTKYIRTASEVFMNPVILADLIYTLE